MRRLQIGLAQINVTVGDFGDNTQKIIAAMEEAKSLGVDLLTFPELTLCGYPPEDLLLKPKLIEENLESLKKVCAHAAAGPSVVVGFVDARGGIYGAAALIYKGQVVGIYHKVFLPNYGVFDENRYFRAGKDCPVYVLGGGVCLGINICEDIWYEAGPHGPGPGQGRSNYKHRCFSLPLWQAKFSGKDAGDLRHG